MIIVDIYRGKYLCKICNERKKRITSPMARFSCKGKNENAGSGKNGVTQTPAHLYPIGYNMTTKYCPLKKHMTRTTSQRRSAGS